MKMIYQAKAIVIEAVQYQKGLGMEDGFAVYEPKHPVGGYRFVLSENVDPTRHSIIQAAVQAPDWKEISEGEWIITYPDGEKDIWTDKTFKERLHPSYEEQMVREYSQNTEFTNYTAEEIFRFGMLKAMEIAGIRIPQIDHKNK